MELIEIWGDDTIQAQLEGCKRNQEVFSKAIQSGLRTNDSAVPRQDQKAQGRVQKNERQTKHNWRRQVPRVGCFDALDDILGHKPTTAPPVVVNSSSEEEPELESPSSPELFDGLPTTSNSEKSTGSRANTPALKPRKHKQSSAKSDRLEIIAGEIVDKLVEGQKSSDHLLLGETSEI